MVVRNIVVINKSSKENYEKYISCKQQLKEEALNDLQKNTRKLVANIVTCKYFSVGLCPTCGHCLAYGELECDECYQKVKWF